MFRVPFNLNEDNFDGSGYACFFAYKASAALGDGCLCGRVAAFGCVQCFLPISDCALPFNKCYALIRRELVASLVGGGLERAAYVAVCTYLLVVGTCTHASVVAFALFKYISVYMYKFIT